MTNKNINSTWQQTFFESLGAASLLLLPFWLNKFTVLGTPIEAKYMGNFYHSALTANHVDFIAALLVTLIIGLSSFIIARLFQTRMAILIWLAHLVCVCLAFNALRIYFFPWLDLGWAKNNSAASLLLLTAVLVSLLIFRNQLPRIRHFSTILGIPFLIIFTINTGVALYKATPESIFSYAKYAAAEPIHSDRSTSPVIWIIFDELDERVGFRERPKDIKMPALDRFRGETTVATQAIPPGDVTLYSIPTLLLGKRINAVKFERADDLKLIPENGGNQLSWRENPGILEHLRKKNIDIAVLAQDAHPYCRIFGKLVSYCWEEDEPWVSGTWTVANRVTVVIRTVLEHVPFVSRYLGKQISTPFTLSVKYKKFMSGVKKALVDPKLEFIFIHWNLPHRPFGYDRHKDTFLPNERVDEKPVLGYLDNLELTDQAFASMRATLERVQRWDKATVIVSADHRWRKAEQHDGIKSTLVPFMVKLPGQQKQSLISKPIFTARTRFLIEKIFGKPLKSKLDVFEVMRHN